MNPRPKGRSFAPRQVPQDVGPRRLDRLVPPAPCRGGVPSPRRDRGRRGGTSAATLEGSPRVRRTPPPISPGKPTMMSAPRAASGAATPEALERCRVGLRDSTPPHRPKDRRRAVLERQMEMRLRSAGLAVTRPQAAVQDPRVERAQPEPAEPFGSPRCASRRARRSLRGLEVPAVGAEVDPGQDDLAVAVRGRAPAARRLLGGGDAPRSSPRTLGMTQKAQRKSQPSWTLRKARARMGRGRSVFRRPSRALQRRARTFAASPVLSAFGTTSQTPGRPRIPRRARSGQHPVTTSPRPGRSRATRGRSGARRGPPGRSGCRY